MRRLCAWMRLAEASLASCGALGEVRTLIFGTAVTGAGNVIKARHQSLSRTGGSDAQLTEVAGSCATKAASSAGHNTTLADSTAQNPRRTLQLLARLLRACAIESAEEPAEKVRDE
jgi:hypothetical protein